MRTLDEAQDELLSKIDKGTHCPCCNHEWLMINACSRSHSKDDMYLWLINGGDKTILSFKQDAGLYDLYEDMQGTAHKPNLHKHIPDDYIKWLASLPLFHEEPGFFFSHAPVPRESWRLVVNRGQPFTKEELTWTHHADEPGIARVHDNHVVGVCGHVHALRKGVKAPRFYDHYIYADAGCGCHPKAPLVAVEVQTLKVTYAWPAEAMETQS